MSSDSIFRCVIANLLWNGFKELDTSVYSRCAHESVLQAWLHRGNQNKTKNTLNHKKKEMQAQYGVLEMYHGCY